MVLLCPLSQVPWSSKAQEANPANWFSLHSFGRRAARSACPAHPCVCVTRSLLLCSGLSWETLSNLRSCSVCETVYTTGPSYIHQCIYTSEKQSSNVIYPRKLLQERQTKLCKVYLADADDFWRHFDLQLCVGIWNCKHFYLRFLLLL